MKKLKNCLISYINLLLLLLPVIGCKPDKPVVYIPPPIAEPNESYKDESTSIETKAVGSSDILDTLRNKLQVPSNVRLIITKTGRTKTLSGGVIQISEEDYRKCQQMGEQANLAFALLIGHELYHVHRQTAGGFNQATGNCNKVEERNADIFAVFYAWYYGKIPVMKNTELVMECLLKNSHASECYPSKEERKKTANQALKESEQLIQLYDHASLSFSMPWTNDQLASALAGLEHLNQVLPGMAEIKNNLAAAKIRMALDEVRSTEFPYAFPVEMDYAFRLKTEKPKSGAADLSKKQRQLLASADSLLDEVQLLIPRHKQAIINRTTIELMKEERKTLSDRKNLGGEWDILRAICLHQNGKVDDAKLILGKLLGKNTPPNVRQLAKVNLAKINGDSYPNDLPDLAGEKIDAMWMELDDFNFMPDRQDSPYFQYVERPKKVGKIGFVYEKGREAILMLRNANVPTAREKNLQTVLCQHGNIQYLARIDLKKSSKKPVEIILLEKKQI